MKKEKDVAISLSQRSVLMFTLIPLGIYVLWQTRDLIFSLLIAFIIMSALRPGVHYLERKGVSRGLAVSLVFLVFVLVFLSLISVIIPPIVIETANLIKNLPLITQEILRYFNFQIGFSDVSGYVPDFTNNILGLISSIFSNTLFVITTLFFSLYFLIEENLVSDTLHRYLSKTDADKIAATILRAEQRMSSWFWGEITLMVVVGVGTFIGLNIIGVRYALALAVLAGLLEAIPNIGPVVSSVPAIIIGLSQSYFTGAATAVLYIIVQQLENNFIVPMIMKKAVGLNPILTLLALLLGGRFGGVLGVLLAIPILLFVEAFLHEYVSRLPKTDPSSK